jgi:Ser-tRNA(Ala) deacylase AlaX
MNKQTDENKLNVPKKDYCTPMHTAEHILNQAMCRNFGSDRAFNAHIEAKKSKCDYHFNDSSKIPTTEALIVLEAEVNDIISRNLEVTSRIVTREEAAKVADLSRLPKDASEMVRLVFVGDYDVCPCIGTHVSNTKEIGKFRIISTDFNDGVFRIRWKVEGKI